MISSSHLTYTGVLLAVFARQLCLPIPAIVILMAAGALAAEGRMRTSIIVALSVLGCIAADGIWFWFGRKWGSQVVRLLCRFTSDPRGTDTHARLTFRRYGPRLLCIAKLFPGLDGVTPPMAGAEGVSVPHFLAFDAVGSFFWSTTYVVVGYLFAKQLDIAVRWAQHFGSILAIVIGVPILVYAGSRGVSIFRMIRRLRVRRMSSAMLERKLKSKKKVAVIDLLNFEDEPDSLPGIPGAMRIDPSRLHNFPRITVPGDVDVVLYSSTGGPIVSARAAMALQRIGVDNVWVLEGGLKAWQERGLPVSVRLESPETVAGRLGLELPAPLTHSQRA